MSGFALGTCFSPATNAKVQKDLRTCPRLCFRFLAVFCIPKIYWPKILTKKKLNTAPVMGRLRCCHRRAFYEHFAMMPFDCGMLLLLLGYLGLDCGHKFI